MHGYKLYIRVFILFASLINGITGDWVGQIVFQDDFNGNSLDLSKWEYQEGCGTTYGSGNLQCYTRRNVQVQNGKLQITARRENMEDKQYTSGRIRQKGSGFTYGAYVISARLARGDYLWPALWLLPINNDCRYEEIDIAEYRGEAPEAKNVEMAGHWGRSWDALKSSGILVTTPWDLSKDFHEYAVLWVPSKIEWYIDKRLFFAVSLTNGTFNSDPSTLPCRGDNQPFDSPTNFIFNLAVGGPFFANFPTFNLNTWTKPNMEIDWVKIYQG